MPHSLCHGIWLSSGVRMIDIDDVGEGWEITRLVKTGSGYHAVIEKSVPLQFYPHYDIDRQHGIGNTPSAAIESAKRNKCNHLEKYA